ncbi:MULTISPECIES: NHLP bacteriocin export ABC transporter permease/ATPase subunit [Pseudanabaena]|jgi:NHLM bacteriocin system ABC transporter ATP-binding protein|uniref:NHLP bacteriocin export ABC transporter permease/ATPase subunit n=1 Tax=Pseudanabaena TaxID=1152 RepID=UPI002478B73F|nr:MULTISPECIES: NHLP bacteriocin export ABC transporter permease/ATPase subunit [Pseudanabaena]MEA5488040.1 NHLP bacteriocin export ABC transporter permease/ATPase subunit [Pseudanabaena sp. CCNP1317]WGS75167.1 NHLP bacteriocin export ABC transporter permease/ATPase subunit [Pseudanabaena galeata CCNP1313]
MDSSTPKIVKGNIPYVLNDPERVWEIRTGTLAIFFCKIQESETEVVRRYLFTVESGEILFGIDNSIGWELIAIALSETELFDVAIADFSAEMRESNRQRQLNLWIYHWSKHLQPQSPLDPVLTDSTQYLSLGAKQALLSSKSQVLWITIRQGNGIWLDLEDRKLEPSRTFPLGYGFWILADTNLEVFAQLTEEREDWTSLPIELMQFHQNVGANVLVLEAQELETNYQRFEARNQQNRDLLNVALEDLVSVLHKPEEKISVDMRGDALLAAAGAVGRVAGIIIRPPSQSEDLTRIKDPLSAIARASQMRIRQVLLESGWWKRESGPMLAYFQEDNAPVALLPKGQSYILFDPKNNTKQAIDEEIAETISPLAFTFYRPLPLIIRNAIDLFSFGLKGYELSAIGIVVFGVTVTLLGMIIPQATAILVNDAIPNSDRSLLSQLGLALFAAAFGQSAFQVSQGILTNRVESAADGVLQPGIWDRLLRLSPAFFRNYSSGDLLSRVLTISQIRSQISGATLRTLLSGIFALLNLALMFVYSWQLSVVIIGISLAVFFITFISSRKIVANNRKQEELVGVLSGFTIQLINGVAKLRVAMAEERAFAAWAKQQSKILKLRAGAQRINDSVAVVSEAIPLITSILLFWFAILFMQMSRQTENPQGLNAGSYLAFASAQGIFMRGITDLSTTATEILEIIPLWERARPILEAPQESDPSKAEPTRLKGHILLDHITFRYREDGPLILDDVTIEAQPREFIAIVGPSGSGKSTIFRLLLGFENPSAGTVFYDGQDLSGLNLQAVRRQFGVVLQNGRINAGSIFDNITAGALATLEEAWEGARMAGFSHDIEQMPMGMHTVISEGGSNLSGGQRQRLLIARALVLKPKIILMDEATSALDNRTQSIVTASLDRLNATRVVIAHRLSTIINADRIFVVEAGRVVEVGNFQQLINEDGLFARLASRQLE